MMNTLRRILCAAAALFLLVLYGAAAYSPLRDRNVFRHHDNAYRKIAITFDDGPHPVYTAQILNLLQRYSVHATFFVIGQNAEQYPALLQRMTAEGHEVGNHTYGHRSLCHMSAADLQAQILRGENAVAECTDVRPYLFRPPEGYCTAEISAMAAAMDYRVILWNIDTCDWQHRSADDIVNAVMETVRSGDIILMHDYIGGVSHTVEAVERLIPALLEKDFQPVTVSELIGSDNGCIVTDE